MNIDRILSGYYISTYKHLTGMWEKQMRIQNFAKCQ